MHVLIREGPRVTAEEPGPRSHSDPAIVAAKRTRLGEPHIAQITALCRRIEATHGPVPDVDPDLGGNLARALLVLESPGPFANAGSGSGFISPWNDDPSAEHVHNLLTSHDIPFGDVSVWNVVPWWLPSDSVGSFRAPRVGELRAGRAWLDELLDLMPRVRVLVAMGRNAERGLAEGDPLPMPLLSCPHPASRSWNQPRLRQAMQEAFATLADVIGGGTPPAPDRRSFWPNPT